MCDSKIVDFGVSHSCFPKEVLCLLCPKYNILIDICQDALQVFLDFSQRFNRVVHVAVELPAITFGGSELDKSVDCECDNFVSHFVNRVLFVVCPYYIGIGRFVKTL